MFCIHIYLFSDHIFRLKVTFTSKWSSFINFLVHHIRAELLRRKWGRKTVFKSIAINKIKYHKFLTRMNFSSNLKIINLFLTKRNYSCSKALKLQCHVFGAQAEYLCVRQIKEKKHLPCRYVECITIKELEEGQISRTQLSTSSDMQQWWITNICKKI